MVDAEKPASYQQAAKAAQFRSTYHTTRSITAIYFTLRVHHARQGSTNKSRNGHSEKPSVSQSSTGSDSRVEKQKPSNQSMLMVKKKSELTYWCINHAQMWGVSAPHVHVVLRIRDSNSICPSYALFMHAMRKVRVDFHRTNTRYISGYKPTQITNPRIPVSLCAHFILHKSSNRTHFPRSYRSLFSCTTRPAKQALSLSYHLSATVFAVEYDQLRSYPTAFPSQSCPESKSYRFCHTNFLRTSRIEIGLITVRGRDARRTALKTTMQEMLHHWLVLMCRSPLQLIERMSICGGCSYCPPPCYPPCERQGMM